jgi:hypothetical protein
MTARVLGIGSETFGCFACIWKDNGTDILVPKPAWTVGKEPVSWMPQWVIPARREGELSVRRRGVRLSLRLPLSLKSNRESQYGDVLGGDSKVGLYMPCHFGGRGW